jgi:hypothetical protein
MCVVQMWSLVWRVWWWLAWAAAAQACSKRTICRPPPGGKPGCGGGRKCTHLTLISGTISTLVPFPSLASPFILRRGLKIKLIDS